MFLDQFARSLRAENKAPATVYTYTSAVAQFAEFLRGKGMPTAVENIRREHVGSFIEHLLATAKPATANNRYRGLQSFFKWLQQEGEIKESPMVNMKPPKVPEQPPPILDEQGIQRLLRVCSGSTFSDRRDTAIIRLLLDTGLRRAELAGLILDDLDPDNQVLHVQGKGGRARVVPYGRKAAQALDRYLRARTAHKGARDRALILTLLDTGLRAGELVGLRLEDLDFESQRIQVRHGKGNKQRAVRIGERASEAVQHYLEQFRGFGLGPLFLTCRGQPLCRSAMRTIFQRLGKEASVPKVHPHRFRHTFATWAIEQQAREIDVQFLLGHSTPAMLRRYTATYDAEKAAQAHALFSPADRLNGRLPEGSNGSRKACVLPDDPTSVGSATGPLSGVGDH